MPRPSTVRCSTTDPADYRVGRPRFVLALVMLLSLAAPAHADLWYEHYAAAEKALAGEEWERAVQELNAAIERRGDSGARVRTYGMKVTAYFPYLKLGVAYYHLGRFEAALQAFETEERLGTIGQSTPANAELSRYRELAGRELRAVASVERERIAEIVQRQLAVVRRLEAEGRFTEAVAALDPALAVDPADREANAALERLRSAIAGQELDLARAAQVRRLVDDGRELLGQGLVGEASSRFREAIALAPDAEAQSLLDEAQRVLRAKLETRDAGASARRTLDAVLGLESAGRVGEALERLQSVLALDPDDDEARSVEARLLRRREAEATARARQESIDRLLAEAASGLREGSAELALAAVNRVLALEPGNATALEHLAAAYQAINRELLGSGATQNIPPALRFVDLRQEADDGVRVQTVQDAAFVLSGVVIDDSPVEVAFYRDGLPLSSPIVDSQAVGDYFVTEFRLSTQLPPGRSTFRLVATDSEDLSSSGEYAVTYRQPFFRRPWFLGALLLSGLVVAAAVWWWRARRRWAHRRRRFNPYVAGAPVLDESMFFGRRDIVDRILQTIHNNSLLLYGERRIGKTSIQHRLRKRLRELDDPDFDFYPVYVDLQGTPEEKFFGTLAEDIFHELAPVLNGLEPVRDPAGDYSYRDFVRDVHAVLKRLKSRSTKTVKLVLQIDEVDELNAYDPRINQKLRSLFMKSFAENLVSVVSGVEIKKRWEREGSPWYNFFEEIEVKPLAEEEARALVERPIRGVFALDDGVVEKIVRLAECRPYLIQKLCMSLVTDLHESGRRRVTVEDVAALGPPGAQP